MADSVLISAADAKALNNDEALVLLDSIVRSAAVKGDTKASCNFYTTQEKIEELLVAVKALGYVTYSKKNTAKVPTSQEYYTVFLDWSA